MAKKRFTDIEIWDKEWYMNLTPTHKCLMKYMFDKCDACGCWKPNWKLASLHINDTVTFNDLSALPQDQYEVLESGKIFIPDFVDFQYGRLSKNSPAHNPVFLAIEKNNLSNRVFNRVYNTHKEEDKEKEEEKEEEKPVFPKKKKDPKLYPTKELFNGLPEEFMQAGIERIKISQNISATKDQITSLWNVFKIQNLTGENYYANDGKVYSHFLDCLKYQKIQNGTAVIGQKSKLGNKSGGFGILADALNKGG